MTDTKTGRGPAQIEPGRAGTLRAWGTGAAVFAAASWIVPALAQDTPEEVPLPNPVLVLDVDLGVRRDDDETALRTGLGLSYATQTRTQELSFRLGTDFDLTQEGIEDDGLFPSLNLDYVRDNGPARLTFGARYRRQDIDGAIPGPGALLGLDDPDFDETDLIEDDGQRETTSVDLGLDLWRLDPVGLELGASYDERRFLKTEDPDLNDTRSLDLSAALRLRPRRGLSFRLVAERDRSEDEGELDSEATTTRLGVGMAWDMTPTTTLNLTVSHSDREERRNVLGPDRIPTGAREDNDDSGLVWNGRLTRDRPNGTMGLSFGRQLTSTGALTEVTANRALDLANGAELSGSLGAASFEDGDTVAVGRLRYDQPLPRGAAVGLSLSRRAAVDGDDQDVARTRVSLTHDRPLGPSSTLEVGVGYAEIEVLEGFEPDETGTDFSVTYRRQLTRDWDLAARYLGTTSRTEGESRTRDSQISVNLNRSFTFRP